MQTPKNYDWDYDMLCRHKHVRRRAFLISSICTGIPYSLLVLTIILVVVTPLIKPADENEMVLLMTVSSIVFVFFGSFFSNPFQKQLMRGKPSLIGVFISCFISLSISLFMVFFWIVQLFLIAMKAGYADGVLNGFYLDKGKKKNSIIAVILIGIGFVIAMIEFLIVY